MIINSSQATYYDKYNSKNLAEKHIMRKLLKNIKKFLGRINPKNILEVGCGEGFVSKYMYDFYSGRAEVHGIDISEEIIGDARKNYSDIKFSVQSAYSLDIENNHYDLVAAFETQEQLEDPGKAHREMKRVCKRCFIFTVPQEPVWRLLNILRLKYVCSLGNTPGHIQHWNRKTFLNMLSCTMRPIEIMTPIPFMQVFCEGYSK
ncbi:MAG: class I SAM-dependent methyltransferase [Elusimicrobia bacterium]|nr:class I SAM-dependent methyltransferase [Elusimicrobiota bacterium]